MPEIILLQPYSFYPLEDNINSYGFTTEKNVFYRISFKPSSYLFGDLPEISSLTFEFIVSVLENPNERLPPPDQKIPHTIASIFRNFYKQQNNYVTLYICDSSDGRQRVRERKFNSWFYLLNTGEIKELFLKLDIELVDKKAEDRTSISIIMTLENPFKGQILQSLEKLKNDYEKDK